jgi:hypothetical protein
MKLEEWMQYGYEDYFEDPERKWSWRADGLEVTESDKRVLRTLGEHLAAIAALPVHAETASRWRALNGLRQVKPMVWISDIPWHEMDVNDELRLQTTSGLSRYHEWELRKLIYQWEHMPTDMVVEPVVYSPLVVHSSGVGIAEDVDIAVTDEANFIVSRHFNVQIRDEDDLEKIKIPIVTHDSAESEQQYQQVRDIFSGIIDVKKYGVNGFGLLAAPWDVLVRAWGVQELFIDLHDRPGLVHKAIDRLMYAYLSTLDQFEQQNLLTLNNGYNRIGSGGLGYTDELPQSDYDPAHVRANDLWGSSTSQIFTSVSPRMHWEFALQYEVRWMSRFGLNYYGCCDRLEGKMSILERIPNLRKVSMCPWVNIDEAVANMGSRYVFSYKPNPAVLAEDTWNLDKAMHELRTVLDKAKAHGCVVEVIMKDISTVRYEPQRLWEWAQMAGELSKQYGD